MDLVSKGVILEYWLCILNETNWNVVKSKGIWGVSERHKNTIEKVEIGDKLVFYLVQEKTDKGVLPSRIAGIGEAVSKVFKDSSRIFSSKGFSSSETFPYRIRVKLELVLEKPLEFKPLIPKLTFIKNKEKWTGHIMGKAMRRIPKEDYETIASFARKR